MDKIPVTLGKEHKGQLEKVSGGGSSGLFHLLVNKYHWGQLWFINAHPGYASFNGPVHGTEEHWRFASNQHEDLKELANEFGDMVMAWYQ